MSGNTQLIISAGMPRAGSGWYYNLTHDLVAESRGQNARLIRKKFHLQRLLTEVNCNMSTLKPYRLIPVYIPVLFGNTYVIKTHAGPTNFTKLLMGRRMVKACYIYRDPRAAMLSAYEYGQKGIINKRPNEFSQLDSLESAAEFIDFYIMVWEAWSQCEGVLVVQYENFVANYDFELDRLRNFLQRDIQAQTANKIIERYRPEKGGAARTGIHFSQGEPERFRRVFSRSQLEKFTELFSPKLAAMGYTE